jgi:hypothetical protein
MVDRTVINVTLSNGFDSTIYDHSCVSEIRDQIEPLLAEIFNLVSTMADKQPRALRVWELGSLKGGI